jgi:hypothetical protein
MVVPPDEPPELPELPPPDEPPELPELPPPDEPPVEGVEGFNEPTCGVDDVIVVVVGP